MLKFVSVISILEHIQYLIVSQDCVVIPGLGAFVSRYVPANFTSDGMSLQPPTRELGFNSSLTHDDGLLTSSITRREGVSYECARTAVEQEVELIQRRLRHEGSLNFPRIGTLTPSSYGALVFTPECINPVFALPMTGLPELFLNTAADSRTIDTKPIVLEVDTTSEETPRRWSHYAATAIKYAASAALLIGVCLTLLTPISPKNVDFASLQPVVNQSEASDFMPDETKYAGRTIFIPQPDVQEATATVERKTDKYFVIVASTTSLKEAKSYVRMHSTLKYPLQILTADGRYRVFAASGNDFGKMSDFRNADPAFAAANPNAWVYSLR